MERATGHQKGKAMAATNKPFFNRLIILYFLSDCFF